MSTELIIAIVAGIIWSEVIAHFGASILLHRYYCHKQFEVPAWFEIIGLYMLSVAYVKTPIGWIASHRMHHAYSDTEKDPHSPIFLGWWKVFSTTWDIPKIPARFALQHILKSPLLRRFMLFHGNGQNVHGLSDFAFDNK